MTDIEFNEVFESYLSSYKYDDGHIKVLRRKLRTVEKHRFESACEYLIANRETTRRPTVASILSITLRGTGGKKINSWREIPEYGRMLERIESGEVTSLYRVCKERDYPVRIQADMIYLLDKTPDYPYERLVTPKALGDTVLPPRGTNHKIEYEQEPETVKTPNGEIPF